MKLGILIDTIGNPHIFEPAVAELNSALEQGVISDASIFYQSLGPHKAKPNFGMFNYTDLWSFNGDLITTNNDGLQFVLDTVHRYNVYYYYGWGESNNFLSLVGHLSDDRVKIICSEEHKGYIERVSGLTPDIICDGFSGIAGKIDECNRNCETVC